MKKFFKISLAEIKKIVLKPTFFVMVACLFVAVIISSFLFSPAKRTGYTSSLPGSSVSALHSAFARETPLPEQDGKFSLHQLVDQSYSEITRFNENDQLEQLQTQVCTVFKSYFYSIEEAMAHGRFEDKDFSYISNLNDATNNLIIYFDKCDNSYENFNYLIKASDFANFRAMLRSLQNTLPKSPEQNPDSIEAVFKRVWSYKARVDNMISTCANLKKISLTQSFFDELKNFKQTADNYLANKEEEIENYYLKNSVQPYNEDRDVIIAYKEILNDYKAGCEITLQVMKNMLDLQRFDIVGGNAGDYLGFEGISTYKLNEDTAFFTYILQNNLDYSRALTALNFDTNSGLKTNGYDFAFFLLSVASLILNLTFIYFACISFSGERHDGLMRMNMTKPVSRTKLYFSKVCALVAMSFVAHLLLGLVFMAVGACVYGAPASVMVCVFGSTSAYAVAPFGMILLRVFTLFLANAFFILLASFVANLFSNPVFSLAISYLALVFSLLTNTLLSTSGFVKFLPFVHTDLTPFFGGGIWGGKFLGSLIYSGASFPLSLIYFIVTTALLIVGGIVAIRRQEN